MSGTQNQAVPGATLQTVPSQTAAKPVSVTPISGVTSPAAPRQDAVAVTPANPSAVPSVASPKQQAETAVRVSRGLQNTRSALESNGLKEDSRDVTVTNSSSNFGRRPLLRGVRSWAAALAIGLGVLTGAPTVGLAQDNRPPAQQVQVQEARVLRVANAQQAHDQWTPDTKLIIVGRVNLDDAAARNLARDMAGKNWTVIVVADASGDSWNGRGGVDAWEWMTGQGIALKGAFQEQKHPETGESNGAIFTIVMAQREMILTVSKAQRDNGVDKITDNAPSGGQLNQWARARLPSGDIAGAARETMAGIDAIVEGSVQNVVGSAKRSVADAQAAMTRLQQARTAFSRNFPGRVNPVSDAQLSQMQGELARAQAELKGKRLSSASSIASAIAVQANQGVSSIEGFERSVATARQLIVDAKAEIVALGKAADALRSEFKVKGSLGNPDLKSMRDRVTAAERAVENDPSRAGADAAAVVESARSMMREIAAYPGAGDTLKTSEGRLSELQGRERASAASGSLLNAKQSLDEARELWSRGESGYSAKIDAAKGSLSSAEREIASADASAATKNFLFWLFMALLGLGTAGAAFVLNRRSAKIGAAAKERLADWEANLDLKFNAMFGELETRMATYMGKGRNYAGETLKIATQARDDGGSLSLYSTKASEILKSARELIHPTGLWGKLVNSLWPSRYETALRRLKDEPIVFKPEDGAEDLYGAGKKRDWREDLYGSLQSQKAFTVTFEQLIADFHKRAQSAAEAIDLVEKALLETPGMIEKSRQAAVAMGEKRETLKTLAASDGLFLVPSVFEKALPAATAGLDQIAESAKNDPVAAYRAMSGQKADSAAARIMDESSKLVAEIVGLRSENGALAKAQDGAKQLAAKSVKTAWVEKALQELSGRAEQLAAQAATSSIAAELPELEAKAVQLDADVASALKALDGITQEAADLAALDTAIASARAEIGAALALSPDKVLREDGLDPSEGRAEAAKQLEKARKALDAGKMDDARTAFQTASNATDEAGTVVTASKAALAENLGNAAAREAAHGAIEKTVAAHQAILSEIEKAYADTVLKLGAGDAAHPNANGTVKDNVAEAQGELAAAAKKMADARKAHKKGELLEAAGLLSDAAGNLELAKHRLGEIAEKKARLEAAVAANATKIGALETSLSQRGIDTSFKTTKPTLVALAAAKQLFADAVKDSKAKRPDPFAVQSSLADVEEAVANLRVSIQNDDDMHAEVKRSLEAAASQLGAAEAAARAAAGDKVQDSAAIAAAYQTIETLERQYRAAKEQFNEPNGDWAALDATADRITNAAAEAAATLKNEVAAAQSATRAISDASAKVSEATNWSGSYGIGVPGSPGATDLGQARSALAAGRYEDAKREAAAAHRAAAAAIEEAEEQVRRERRRREDEARRAREAAEAAERARRRAAEEAEERRRRSSSSSSSSWGSSSSSRSSWGGSSSGSSRSSWGGSSSGSSRSSW